MSLKDIFRSVPVISAGEARKQVESPGEPPLLLDVREPREYESGHIPGAVHISLSSLSDRIGEIAAKRPVITYCKAGRRSRSAASLLLGAGFPDVRSMEGGIDAWSGHRATGSYEQGLSVVTENATPAELLGLALAFERGSGRFYRGLETLFGEEDARETFGELARAEEIHVKNIIDGASGLGITDLRESDVKDLMEGAFNVEEALSWCRETGRSPYDILELAMQIETNSLDLYLKLLRRGDIAPVAGIFRGIVEEEKSHLKRVGALLEERA